MNSVGGFLERLSPSGPISGHTSGPTSGEMNLVANSSSSAVSSGGGRWEYKVALAPSQLLRTATVKSFWAVVVVAAMLPAGAMGHGQLTNPVSRQRAKQSTAGTCAFDRCMW